MNVKKVRKSTGLRQADFWKRVFITQSGGCRYEKGDRRIPKTILALLTIAYSDNLTASAMYCKLRSK